MKESEGKKMSVKIVRLVNNEEVMGTVTQDENSTTIKDGAVIVPIGEGKMAIVPWLPHAEETEFTFSNEKVMYVFTPIRDLLNEYNSRFGNGIVIPSGSPGGDIPNLKLTD